MNALRHRRPSIAAAAFAVVACLAACTPNPADTLSNPTPAALQADEPLRLDPTDPPRVEGWWTNGRQLLLLVDDGGYKLWQRANRYESPFQVGRWSRQNYQTLWIEPYGTRAPERHRCELDAVGSEIRLTIPGVPAMVRFDEAPPSAEDHVVGAWDGPGGRLQLMQDGRYRAEAPQGASASEPVVLAGHGGRWAIDADRLLLIPDSPSVPPVVLAIAHRSDGGVELRAGDGAYIRPLP